MIENKRVFARVMPANVAAGLYVPALASLLRFEPPDVTQLALAALLAVSAGGWYGMWRRLI